MSIEALIGDRIYLDTNVFIYFVERHSEFEDTLRALFEAIDGEAISAVTSELTLAEALVKPIADRRPDVGALYTKLLSRSTKIDVRPLDRATLVKSAEHRALFGGRAFDAIHVATARLAECDTILSEDRRLAVPPPLHHIRLTDLKEMT